MPRRPGWTRDEAIHYLKNNVNYLDLVRNSPRARALGDQSTGTLKRYASGLWQADLEGRQIKHLGELRGHTATENKTKRPPKKGYEHWKPPPKTRRGSFLVPRGPGQASGVVRVTSGERAAMRFLASMAKTKRTKGSVEAAQNFQVSMHVQGYRVGEQSDLFTKGGWNPETLLTAAGYRRGARGRWYRPKGAAGLERFIVGYVAANSRSPGAARMWDGVRLWQIFGWAEPEKDASGMADRRRLSQADVNRAIDEAYHELTNR